MLDKQTATELVRRHVADGLTVTRMRPLHGGMINQVQEWFTDSQPAAVVAKLSERPNHAGFRTEHDTLAWYRAHTAFPVPAVTGFVDGDASFADPEFELAYLLVFNTADPTFFDVYTQHHPLRDGFQRRCRVYWLNTMRIHVRVFGARYIPRTEHIAREIEALA